ncbi:unnamed protein product [Spirodela intermedia]|uniref:Uncharacterized protein n=1 Tax=Spirodela intermedia TaxID=51605 RepID=A0A7I8LC21_SPIIN|nr:unnamed protein product [Spirodela intermedia]
MNSMWFTRQFSSSHRVMLVSLYCSCVKNML